MIWFSIVTVNCIVEVLFNSNDFLTFYCAVSQLSVGKCSIYVLNSIV